MRAELHLSGFFALCACVLLWILLLETGSLTWGGIVMLLGLALLTVMVIRRL